MRLVELESCWCISFKKNLVLVIGNRRFSYLGIYFCTLYADSKKVDLALDGNINIGVSTKEELLFVKEFFEGRGFAAGIRSKDTELPIHEQKRSKKNRYVSDYYSDFKTNFSNLRAGFIIMNIKEKEDLFLQSLEILSRDHSYKTSYFLEDNDYYEVIK